MKPLDVVPAAPPFCHAVGAFAPAAHVDPLKCVDVFVAAVKTPAITSTSFFDEDNETPCALDAGIAVLDVHTPEYVTEVTEHAAVTAR